MLQHVVLFKLKPEYMEEIPQLVQGFLNMRGKIDGLVELHAGADILKSERSYDLGLVCVFRDKAAFDAYQTHPVHQPVRKKMHEVRLSSGSCDFELY